jgi:hypothetical protein
MMNDHSQLSKPGETAQHASLPFQGKSLPRPFGVGWGMGSHQTYAETISVKHKSTSTLKSVASSFAASRQR